MWAGRKKLPRPPSPMKPANKRKKRPERTLRPPDAERAVKDQYEEFPYPSRDPREEPQRLIKTILEGMPCINHFVFGGHLDFTKPLRVLVAGGGTGDSLI